MYDPQLRNELLQLLDRENSAMILLNDGWTYYEYVRKVFKLTSEVVLIANLISLEKEGLIVITRREFTNEFELIKITSTGQRVLYAPLPQSSVQAILHDRQDARASTAPHTPQSPPHVKQTEITDEMIQEIQSIVDDLLESETDQEKIDKAESFIPTITATVGESLATSGVTIGIKMLLVRVGTSS